MQTFLWLPDKPTGVVSLATMRPVIHSQGMRQCGKAKSWGETPLTLKNLILLVILFILSPCVLCEPVLQDPH